jgi:hypothetical protein
VLVGEHCTYLWAGKSWSFQSPKGIGSSRARHVVLLANDLLYERHVLLSATHQISLCAGPRAAGGLSWCCKKNSLPRGRSAAGAGPSWVGGTRAMPSGEIWGGNGPAAGALNRAY